MRGSDNIFISMPDPDVSPSCESKCCSSCCLGQILGGLKLTVMLMAIGVALLFFATLDCARYGQDIAARAYFGSIIAIWQYPSEWQWGTVLSRFWLPLPGAPLLAFAGMINLIAAGWLRVGKLRHSLYKKEAGLLLAHLGVVAVIVGFFLLLFGNYGYATVVVISGISAAICGLVMFYLPTLLRFLASVTPATAEPMSSAARRLNRSWFFAPLIGVLAGVFIASSNGAQNMVAVYAERHLDLMPIVFYVPALALLVYYWIRKRHDSQIHRLFAYPLLNAALVAHSVLPACIVIIRGRPPVMDLHSSIVFAGWIAAIAAYYIERRRKDGLAFAASALSGIVTLCLAAYVGADFRAVSPVLDSNQWLILHVVTIAAGYGAVLLAVILANMYLVGKLASVSAEKLRVLSFSAYGFIVGGLVLCCLGILMGGLWAESAWGRFWGWDPKENSALMLVLWTALILHARNGNIARESGFMRLTACAGLVLAWSWAGTNLLGAGLHSYGFAASGAWMLAGYAVVQLALVFTHRKNA